MKRYLKLKAVIPRISQGSGLTTGMGFYWANCVMGWVVPSVLIQDLHLNSRQELQPLPSADLRPGPSDQGSQFLDTSEKEAAGRHSQSGQQVPCYVGSCLIWGEQSPQSSVKVLTLTQGRD